MENIPKKNSLDSMEGIEGQEAKANFKTKKEEHFDVAAPGPSGETSGRLSSLRRELTGQSSKGKERDVERRKQIEEYKEELKRSCEVYFRECETIDSARVQRKIIEGLHSRLIKLGIPWEEELSKFEADLVDMYANKNGEPVIRYPNLWAKIKDRLFENTLGRHERENDPNRSLWKPMTLSDKEGEEFLSKWL